MLTVAVGLIIFIIYNGFYNEAITNWEYYYVSLALAFGTVIWPSAFLFRTRNIRDDDDK